MLDNEPDVLSHRILRGVDDEDEILGCKFVVYAECVPRKMPAQTPGEADAALDSLAGDDRMHRTRRRFRNDDAFDSHIQSAFHYLRAVGF